MNKFVGGNEIYGLRTVNCGEIYEFDICDPINPMRNMMLEILRPEKHNPYAQIVCYYLWDTTKCAKIEITVYKLDDGTVGSEIYYFKNQSATQHYRSSNHPNFVKLPKKYQSLIKYIQQGFNEIYN